MGPPGGSSARRLFGAAEQEEERLSAERTAELLEFLAARPAFKQVPRRERHRRHTTTDHLSAKDLNPERYLTIVTGNSPEERGSEATAQVPAAPDLHRQYTDEAKQIAAAFMNRESMDLFATKTTLRNAYRKRQLSLNTYRRQNLDAAHKFDARYAETVRGLKAQLKDHGHLGLDISEHELAAHGRDIYRRSVCRI